MEWRLLDEAPVGAFDVDIADNPEEATFDDRDAAEVAFIWLGAGDAVLWLDTESGRAVSSITISPGEPGESGGISFELLEETGPEIQGFFEILSSWPDNGLLTPVTVWFGLLAFIFELLLDPVEPSPFVISSTILFFT